MLLVACVLVDKIAKSNVGGLEQTKVIVVACLPRKMVLGLKIAKMSMLSVMGVRLVV